MRKKIYDNEYIENLSTKFIEKIHKDKNLLTTKLSVVGISKGTYNMIYNKKRVSKRVIEKMKAYLENRKPVFDLIDSSCFYCVRCDSINDIKLLSKTKTYCKKCRADIDKVYYEKDKEKVLKCKYKWRLSNRGKYLESRSIRYLKKTYGEFSKCVYIINQIKKDC